MCVSLLRRWRFRFLTSVEAKSTLFLMTRLLRRTTDVSVMNVLKVLGVSVVMLCCKQKKSDLQCLELIGKLKNTYFQDPSTV